MQSLDEFVDYETDLLKRFKDWWLENQKTDPDNFPMSLFQGDWLEQVSTFDDMNNDEVCLGECQSCGAEVAKFTMCQKCKGLFCDACMFSPYQCQECAWEELCQETKNDL